MSLKGWRLFVFWVFIPVSSCKETLGPRHHRARRWISFNPSCQSYEKPWHRQGPTQCWMPWGAAKWWATDGWMEMFLWGDFQQKKIIYFGRCFWWTWWKLNLKNMRKNPSELPGFHWGGFVLCESTILAAPKQRVRLGVVLVLVWNCSIQSSHRSLVPVDMESTPLKINMEPKNAGLEDDFPFQIGDFPGCPFF